MILKTEQDEIQNYLVDASNTKGFCDAVYIPENQAEVSQILSEANTKKICVTVSGNLTGLTGAGVPQGGIVLSTEKLNKIIDLNLNDRTALIEPGVILSQLKTLADENGLFYPPDPTELNCFVGGTVATNASGAETFKYGPTRNYIAGLEIVLADGDILKLNRGENFAKGTKLKLSTLNNKTISISLPGYKMPQTKNASGYYCKENMDAIDLFIGSEGTLGVITKIKLRLLPKPNNSISCVAFFNDEKDALAFLTGSRNESYKTRKEDKQRALDAAALEFFDGNALRFLSKQFPNIPPAASAAVWFEQKFNSDDDFYIDLWINQILKYNGSQENVWFALNENEKVKIRRFRHAISESVNDYITRNNFRKLGTDVAVPDNEFTGFYFSTKILVESEGIDYVNYGHFGNSHMHLNLLPKSDDEFERGKILYDKICFNAIELGGTFSAEHGVGKNKTGLLLKMYGKENVDKMKAVKKILDPNYILNIGNIFRQD